jgi:hypothetical protein
LKSKQLKHAQYEPNIPTKTIVDSYQANFKSKFQTEILKAPPLMESDGRRRELPNGTFRFPRQRKDAHLSLSESEFRTLFTRLKYRSRTS